MEQLSDHSCKESPSKAETPPPLIKIERVFSLSEEEFEKTKKENRTSVLGKEDDYLQAFSKAFNNFSKDITKPKHTDTSGSLLSHQKLGSSSTPSYEKAGLLDKTIPGCDKEPLNGKTQWSSNGLAGHKKPRLSLDQFVSSPSEQESSFISQLQKLHSFTDSEQESGKKYVKYDRDSTKERFTTGTPPDKTGSEKLYQVLNSNKGLPALIKFSDKDSEQSRKTILLEKYKKYLFLQNQEQKTRTDSDSWKRKVLSDYLTQLRRHQFNLNEKKTLNLTQTPLHAGRSYASAQTEVSSSIELPNPDSIPKTLTDEKALQRRKKLHDMIEEIKRTSKPEKQDDLDCNLEGAQKQHEDILKIDRQTEKLEKFEYSERPMKFEQDINLQFTCKEPERPIQYEYERNERYPNSEAQSSLTRSFLGGFTGRVSPDDPDLYKPRTYKRLENGKPSALQKLEDKLSKEEFCDEEEGDSGEQKILKLERKRYLSRIASYKSRKKRLEREERLAQHVESLKEEKIRLEMMKSFANKELQEVRTIIKNHLQLGCDDKQVVERLVYSLNNFS